MTPKNSVIHCGDSLAVMRDMPSKSVDIIITSPPYNLGRSRGSATTNHFDGGNMKKSKLKNGYANHGDNLEYDEYVRWQKAILLECWRVLADTGAIFYNHKPRLQMGLLQTPLDLNPGLPLRQIIIWDRGSPSPNFSQRFYVPMCEWIVVYAKPDFKLRDTAASAAGDVWKFGWESHNPHPAPFPVELPLRILQSTKATNVLDCFCGSGSVGVACIQTNKKFIGIDNSEEYVAMARNRLYLAEQGDFSGWRAAGA